MADDPSARLRAQLGGAEIGGLALSDEQADHLAATIAAARERQSRALQEAADGSLRHVPRLMRGAIKKLLFG